MIPTKPETRSFGCLWLIAFVVTLTMDVTRTGLAEARRDPQLVSVRHLQHVLAACARGVAGVDRNRDEGSAGPSAVALGEPMLRDGAGLSRVRVERLDLPPPAFA